MGLFNPRYRLSSTRAELRDLLLRCAVHHGEQKSETSADQLCRAAISYAASIPISEQRIDLVKRGFLIEMNGDEIEECDGDWDD